MSTSDQAAHVLCPHCSYDVRGVRAADGLYRCPECGTLSNLRDLTRVRRARSRLWWRLAMAALVVVMGLLLVMLASR